MTASPSTALSVVGAPPVLSRVVVAPDIVPSDIVPLPDDIGQHILVNPTGAERAFTDVEYQRVIGTHAEIIRDIWDPNACPVGLLPFLAWAMGVNFWNDAWSEQTKRLWIALQWLYKSLRGTEAGVRMAVDFAGRDVSPFGYHVRQITTRPQQVFSGPSLTKEQREEWLSTLPQIRVYYYRSNGPDPLDKAFLGPTYGSSHGGPFFLDSFMLPSVAKTHLERRATYNVNGVDTDTTVTDFGNFYQLHIKGDAGDKVFVGDEIGGKFFIPSDAWKRLITVAPTPLPPRRVAIGPSVEPIQALPEFVQIAGDGTDGVYTGSNFQHNSGSFMNDHNYFIPSTAKFRVFDRFAINDGSDFPVAMPNKQFMGIGRYGWPAFTVQTDVSMAGKRTPYAAGDDFYVPKDRFWIPHDPKPIEYVCSAIESWRALRDRSWLKTGPTNIFVAGEAFIAGVDSFIVGKPNEVF